MRRSFGLVPVVLLAALVTGCSDDPGTAGDPTPGGSSGPTATTTPATTPPATTTPGEDEPGSTTSPTRPPDEVIVGEMARTVVDIDTADDVKRTKRCLAETPTAAECSAEVSGLVLSAEALVIQLKNFRSPPPDQVSELFEQTVTLAEAVRDRSSAYVTECPQAGATSPECVDQLDVLLTEVGDPLVAVMRQWRPLFPR